MHRFLVTGSGHSGTRYIAELLRTCGVPTGHEWVYGPGGSRLPWGRLVGDVSLYVVPTLADPQETAWRRKAGVRTIVHVVRDPRLVIASWLRSGVFGDESDPAAHEALHRTIRGFAPEVFTEPTALRRAAAFWVRWVDEAEAWADRTFLIEGLDAEELLRCVGYPCDAVTVRTARDRIEVDQRNRLFDWDDLPCAVRAHAEELGY